MNSRFFAVLTLVSLLGFQAAAWAQEAAPAADQPSFGGILTRMAFMFLMVFMIFHLLIIKPQKTKIRDQQDMLNKLKRGDQVVTSGGLCGRFSGTEKDFVLLEIAPNVKVKVETAHIQKKLDIGQVEKAA